MHSKYRNFIYPFTCIPDKWDYLLKESVERVKDYAPSKKLQEPDYTAGIVMFFPELVNQYFPYYNCRFGGYFIHQRPYVTFYSEESKIDETCEMGDLLVICKKKEKGKYKYNAALLQLKIAHKILQRVKKGERKQLYLYMNWPIFHFIVGSNITYDICPKTVTSGAQYLFVRKSFPNFYHSIPMEEMDSQASSFGTFLYNFIQWQTGRPIEEEKNKDRDEWSRAIWDLIDRNRNHMITRGNIGVTDFPRNNDKFLSMVIDNDYIFYCSQDQITSYLYGENKSDEINQQEQGISMLLIDIDDPDEE